MSFEVEYRMLNGEAINRDNPRDIEGYNVGDFISLTEEKPEGMFRISEKGKFKLILEQIDCDPLHWKGGAHGPDDKCRNECKFYDACPISTHLMLCADID